VDLGILLAVTIVFLLAGTVVLLARRRPGRRKALIAVLLMGVIVATGAGLSPSAPASATLVDCLEVTQTSVNDGLAPDAPPTAITGLVVNRSAYETHVFSVKVEITSVTVNGAAPAGTCDASDYVLLNAVMPVDRLLGPEGSAPFAGASIGFTNTSTNQDACQGAVVHLLYTANP
jgi:hypothetical protein